MVSAIEKEAQLLNNVQALIKAQSTRMSLYKEFNELSKNSNNPSPLKKKERK